MVKKKVRTHLPQADKGRDDSSNMQPPPKRIPCISSSSEAVGAMRVENKTNKLDFNKGLYEAENLGRPQLSQKRRRKSITLEGDEEPTAAKQVKADEETVRCQSDNHAGKAFEKTLADILPQIGDRADMSPIRKDYVAVDDTAGIVAEDPDWDTITQHHPASKDVPIFLDAREKRRVLDEQMMERLNDWNDAMHNGIDDIGRTLLEIVHTKGELLDDMEEELKHTFVDNEHNRADMQQKLEESHREAQSLYASLMMQVLQPLSQTNAHIAFGVATDKK